MAAQACATAELALSLPGDVAQPPFSTKLPCMYVDTFLSSTKLLVASAECGNLSTQMGAKTATTALLEASSARFAAVLSSDQPPQLNPTIMVTTAPATSPGRRRLNDRPCNIEGNCIRHPSIKESKSGGHPDGCRLNELAERTAALRWRVDRSPCAW